MAAAPVMLPGAANGDLQGYSLGPVSSEQFPDLIEAAIPPGEGEAHLFGPVDLWVTLDNRSFILSAVASLTDTRILLLKWHDPEERYKIVADLAYSDILAHSMNSAGLGRIINLCLTTPVFTWGDQAYAMGRHASLAFIKPDGIHQDVKKTEAVNDWLGEKITPVEGACDAPAEVTDEGVEAALGAWRKQAPNRLPGLLDDVT